MLKIPFNFWQFQLINFNFRFLAIKKIILDGFKLSI